MKKYVLLFIVAGSAGAALAREGAEVRQAPVKAEAVPQSPAAPAAPQTGDALASEEQQARSEATMSLLRLELVLGRKALRDGRAEDAARKALRALELTKQLPAGVDAGEYELQAEGILAKAGRSGVNVEALRRETMTLGSTDLPPAEDDAKLDAKAREAGKLARGYSGSPTPDIDTSGDERVLRERAQQTKADDTYGYRPSQGIVDADALAVREGERVYYQAAVEGAYKDSEVRALVEAHESRVIPDGIISYPPDWPEKMKKREQYRGGMITRGPSWHDKDGREWYVAVYDIHDLIYVPPDFVGVDVDPLTSDRDALDRDALRWGSDIFRRGAGELAAGIPLLRYFGGMNDWVFRGPKYSLQREQEVVQLIEAFTGKQEPEAKVIPLPP